MKDLIVLAVIIVILAIPTIYIIRAKKNGVHCIGCPDAKTCKGHCPSTQDDETQEEKPNDNPPPSCGGNCAGCSGGCH